VFVCCCSHTCLFVVALIRVCLLLLSYVFVCCCFHTCLFVVALIRVCLLLLSYVLVCCCSHTCLFVVALIRVQVPESAGGHAVARDGSSPPRAARVRFAASISTRQLRESPGECSSALLQRNARYVGCGVRHRTQRTLVLRFILRREACFSSTPFCHRPSLPPCFASFLSQPSSAKRSLIISHKTPPPPPPPHTHTRALHSQSPPRRLCRLGPRWGHRQQRLHKRKV
jgi:hypothetical protein